MFSEINRFIKPFIFILSSLFSLTLVFFFITFITLLIPNIAHCFDRSFAWNANTEPDLAGYYIYYKNGDAGPPYDGTGADEGDSPIKIPLISLADPENPEYTLHGLSDVETFYFVSTAYDIYGNESDYSNELSFQPSSSQSSGTSINIIDNGDPGTSFTGTWSVSSGTDPWDPADPSATSLWSRNGDTYTWTITPSISGTYEISMWWTEYSSRSNSVPVTIRYRGGTDTLLVNQQQNGGQWNLLNSYPFEAGVSYDITITSAPGGVQNYSTCADAVQFIYQPGLNVLPVATIDSISPNPAPVDSLVTFTGHGDDIDGAISLYSWDSSRDGHLGDSATFTTSSPLSPGSHTISFTVVDNDGEESVPVIRTLIVQDTLNEIIIDNGDPGTSFTGTWSVSGGTDPWDSADPSATSLWSRNGDTYTWTFTPSISGTYEIFMWWTQYASRSTNIPVSIEFSGGKDTVTVNQQFNTGIWNSLGSYPFVAGVSYDITITSQPWPSSTCADSVRFVNSVSP